MENDAGGSQSFFHVRIFLRIFVAYAKIFLRESAIYHKNRGEGKNLQNDKKVDVCVEMQTELW